MLDVRIKSGKHNRREESDSETNKNNLKSGFLDKPRSQVLLKLIWPHMSQNR